MFVMKKLSVLAIVLVFMFSSCLKEDHEPISELNILFELLYDGEPLHPTPDYFQLNDSVEVQFTKVSFYLSDFRVESTEGELEILDILHLSYLQNLNGDAVEENQQLLRFSLPASEYSSLSFGLGVTPSQNATKPAEHAPGTFLSFASEYWEAWDSYVFEKIEGRYKVNGGDPETMALHIGGDETYRKLEWKDVLSLSGDDSEVFEISIDLKDILQNYPLTEAPVLHSEEQLSFMNLLADQFAAYMN